MSAYRNYRNPARVAYTSRVSESSDEGFPDYDYKSALSATSVLDILLNRVERLEIGEEKRRYGYFRCPTCRKRWESAQTWCEYEGVKNGVRTFKPISTQACKLCKVMTLPEDTKELDKKAKGEVRHNDEKRPHRSDLCSRCLGGLVCKGY